MGPERVAARWLRAKPAGDLAGVQTYTTERHQKGIPPSSDPGSRLPGDSPRSTRDQAAPQPPSTNEEGKVQHPPAPTGFQGPGPSGSGVKVPVRTLGKPGDQYGHPFKGNNPGQRRTGDFYLERFPNTGGEPGRPSQYNPLSRHPDTEHRDHPPAQSLDGGRVDNNPGSARVVPSGHGFVNREASALRVAARYEVIVRGLDPGITRRSGPLKPQLKVDRPTLRRYVVKGSEDTYTITVASKESDGPWAERDLKLACTCDFWRWQGPEHWARAGGYLYGKPGGTADAPDQRDPEKRHRICKHAAAVLREIIGTAG